MQGWIKLHRRAQANFLYTETRPHTRREAWEDILLMVNHEPSKVVLGDSVYTCKRGQSLRSVGSWARHFGWTMSRTRRFFKLLESESMLRLESVQKSTRLTVLNYEIYQGDRTANEQQTNSKRTANGDKQECKEGKKKKKTTTSAKEFEPPSLESVIAYKAEIGSKISPQKFIAYYSSKSWMIGKGSKQRKMKDWKRAFRYWTQTEKLNNEAEPTSSAQAGKSGKATRSEWES